MCLAELQKLRRMIGYGKIGVIQKPKDWKKLKEKSGFEDICSEKVSFCCLLQVRVTFLKSSQTCFIVSEISSASISRTVKERSAGRNLKFTFKYFSDLGSTVYGRSFKIR